MYMERLLSVIRREIVRTMRKYHNAPRMGLVSAYNKTNHAVKVKFQPEGTESGWIPLTGLGVGNQFGIASAPNINDQVEVHFHQSDHLVARVLTRHWSKLDKPPQVEAGEHILVHQSGSTIYCQKDGTVTIAGSGYTQTGTVGQGASGNLSTEKNGETGAPVTQQQPTQTQSDISIILQPDGQLILNATKDKITLNSPKIELNGDVYLGGTDSTATRPVSASGTVTTDGASDASNFLSKVWGL